MYGRSGCYAAWSSVKVRLDLLDLIIWSCFCINWWLVCSSPLDMRHRWGGCTSLQQSQATQLRVTLASLPLNTVERNTQFQSSIECTAKTSRDTNLLSRSRSFQELTGISVFLALYLYRSPGQSLTIRLSAVEESPLRMIPPVDFRMSSRGYRVKDEFHIGRPSMRLYSTSHLRSGIFCRIFPWFIHLRCFRNGHCIRRLDMRLKFYLQLPLGLNSGFRQSLLHVSFDFELIWFDWNC